MNDVKTFRAKSMQEALAIVRRELGADAVVLHTRHITQRRLLPFLKAKEEVEITAGVSVRERSAEPVADQSRRTGTLARHSENDRQECPSYEPEATPTKPATGVSKATLIAEELERRQVEKTKLEHSLRSLEAATGIANPATTSPAGRGFKREGEAPAEPEAGSDSDSPRGSAGASPSQRQLPSRTVALPEPPSWARKPNEAFRQSVATPQADTDAIEFANQAATLAAAMQSAVPLVGPVNELTTKVDALQKMVADLTRSSHSRGHEEIPSELFEIYTHLIDAEIENEVARELVYRLRDSCSLEQLQDPVAARAILSAMVEADIRCADPIRPTNGRRKIVALVGPTGVGKTTTIAKLAANFRLRDGIRMGLVTVDTYRIAAVEQLRTYAEIIDLPMKVVTSPQDMRRALDELTGLDLVLIDTAGRSPRDELKIQELKSMLSEAQVDEVHLVMSLNASVRSIKLTADQFKPINPTAVVLTKLDESAGMGSLLSVSRQIQLPLSYVTTGQDVPDDIEPANAGRLSRLVLGQDRLFD